MMKPAHEVNFELDNHLTVTAYFDDPETYYEMNHGRKDLILDGVPEAGWAQRMADSKKLSTSEVNYWRNMTQLSVAYTNGEKTISLDNIDIEDVRTINGAEALELVRGDKTSSEGLPDYANVLNADTIKNNYRPDFLWRAFIEPGANWNRPGTKAILFRDHRDMTEYVYDKFLNKLTAEQNRVLISTHGEALDRPLDDDVIKNLRTSEGRSMTQTELAKRAKISRGALISAENNESVSIDTLMKIAHACNKMLKISFE